MLLCQMPLPGTSFQACQQLATAAQENIAALLELLLFIYECSL
jgi:hypothetical protein